MNIACLTARALDVSMKKPFGISGGAQVHARNVLVTIDLEDGTRGYGEGAPFPAFNGETQEQVLAACARVELAGCDVDATDALRERLRHVDAPSAVCAIETAIMDARARRAGKPLHVLLGGAESSLTTDITITTGSIEDAIREAREFHAFKTLKIKVGGTSVDLDVNRVRAVRKERPDALVLVDANAGFTVEEALAFAEGVKSSNVALFEQPIKPGNWEALAEVRQKSGLRIAIDESVTRAEDVTQARKYGAADAANAKIMKSGVFEVLAIAERAKAEGLDRMIGGMVETRLAMGMSAAIAAGLGGFTFIDLDTPLFLAEDPFEGGYEYEGDRLRLSPIAGLGLKPSR